MTEETGNRNQVRQDNPPCPAPGFETELLREVERLVSALPLGTATLKISRVPEHPDWSEPYFEVTPTNSKAARFEGIAVADDLTLIVGKAEREFIGFAHSGTIIRGATWKEELGWIFESIIKGGFTQIHYLDSRGKVIGWTTKFLVNGTELVFRNGRRREHLLGQERVEIVTYEAY